jgi:precorrin-6B methylase 1
VRKTEAAKTVVPARSSASQVLKQKRHWWEYPPELTYLEWRKADAPEFQSAILLTGDPSLHSIANGGAG